LAAFSFESRQFAQGVDLSSVVSVIQQVDGVMAVDIDFLYPVQLVETKPSFNIALGASDAHWTSAGMAAAQLMMIDPEGITLSEMKI
jgi:hypothetical protein